MGIKFLLLTDLHPFDSNCFEVYNVPYMCRHLCAYGRFFIKYTVSTLYLLYMT